MGSCGGRGCFVFWKNVKFFRLVLFVGIFTLIENFMGLRLESGLGCLVVFGLGGFFSVSVFSFIKWLKGIFFRSFERFSKVIREELRLVLVFRIRV